ncbi:MAG: hypothetical protein N4A49_04880 [Marinifilaceae bacterium]|nr:hypothetical protein [Marinifilaceae bacterium]
MFQEQKEQKNQRSINRSVLKRKEKGYYPFQNQDDIVNKSFVDKYLFPMLKKVVLCSRRNKDGYKSKGVKKIDKELINKPAEEIVNSIMTTKAGNLASELFDNSVKKNIICSMIYKCIEQYKSNVKGDFVFVPEGDFCVSGREDDCLYTDMVQTCTIICIVDKKGNRCLAHVSKVTNKELDCIVQKYKQCGGDLDSSEVYLLGGVEKYNHDRILDLIKIKTFLETKYSLFVIKDLNIASFFCPTKNSVDSFSSECQVRMDSKGIHWKIVNYKAELSKLLGINEDSITNAHFYLLDGYLTCIMKGLYEVLCSDSTFSLQEDKKHK